MIAGADEQLRSDLMLDVADDEAEEPNLYYEPLDDVSILSVVAGIHELDYCYEEYTTPTPSLRPVSLHSPNATRVLRTCGTSSRTVWRYSTFLKRSHWDCGLCWLPSTIWVMLESRKVSPLYLPSSLHVAL